MVVPLRTCTIFWKLSFLNNFLDLQSLINLLQAMYHDKGFTFPKDKVFTIIPVTST